MLNAQCTMLKRNRGRFRQHAGVFTCVDAVAGGAGGGPPPRRAGASLVTRVFGAEPGSPPRTLARWGGGDGVGVTSARTRLRHQYR